MSSEIEKRAKPIPAKIILVLRSEIYSGEKFIGLSSTMYQQRLIYAEPRELRKNGSELELSVIFLDNNSADNWLNNVIIKEYWSEIFYELLTDDPITFDAKDVIIEVDKIFNCDCLESDFYLLKGRGIGFYNELTCGNCLGIFPYSRIPLSIKIEEWQTHYQRVYLNWLESSFFESPAKRQLTNYKKGILNKEGEKIRKQLADFFGKPVYMKYFVEEPDIDQTCVICGGKGTKSGLKRPSKVCKKCNTAFDYSER